MKKNRPCQSCLSRVLGTIVFVSLLGGPASSRADSSYALTPVSEARLQVLLDQSPQLQFSLVDVMYDSSFPLEDRVFMYFDLSPLPQATPVLSANLTFFLENEHNGVPAAINLFTFYGQSSVQASDWDSGQYDQGFSDATGVRTLDLTTAVQSAFGTDQRFLDLRFSTTADPSAELVIDPAWQSPRVSLTVVLAPEPSALSLLACGLALSAIRRRRCRATAPRDP